MAYSYFIGSEGGHLPIGRIMNSLQVTIKTLSALRAKLQEVKSDDSAWDAFWADEKALFNEHYAAKTLDCARFEDAKRQLKGALNARLDARRDSIDDLECAIKEYERQESIGRALELIGM